LLVVAGALGGRFSGAPALAHEGGFELRSTESGGGTLAVTGGPQGAVAVALIFCSNGECLYEHAETTIETPGEDLASPPLFALAAGTQLALEVVSLDAGVAIKLGGAKLDEVGEAASLGTTPGLHAEPIFQVTTAEGAVGDWHVAVRITSPVANYADSDVIEIVLTNDPNVCGDGHVDEHETCDAGDEPWTNGRACTDHCEWLACGDPDGDGEPRASDALFVLATAVGTHACDACLCDVDASGGVVPISSVDALHLLAAAIGIGSAPLECPSCQ
jgi:hypothetical protein